MPLVGSLVPEQGALHAHAVFHGEARGEVLTQLVPHFRVNIDGFSRCGGAAGQQHCGSDNDYPQLSHVLSVGRRDLIAKESSMEPDERTVYEHKLAQYKVALADQQAAYIDLQARHQLLQQALTEAAEA